MNQTIKIQIKYLSTIRDHIGHKQEEVHFSKGATLEDVSVWLNTHYSLSLPNSQITATLNGKGWGQYPLKLSTQLKEGDTIFLLPIVSGG